MSQDPKVDLLASVPLFSGLGRGELDDLARLVEEVDVPAGRVLMRQGDTGNEMFVVVRGKVAVDRGGQRVAELGPGVAVGEMALLSEGSRTATVTTLEPSRFLVVAHREFHSLMEGHPTVQRRVMEGLADRIRAIDVASAH
jgi:CRP-like cAMP-binding protein